MQNCKNVAGGNYHIALQEETVIDVHYETQTSDTLKHLWPSTDNIAVKQIHCKETQETFNEIFSKAFVLCNIMVGTEVTIPKLTGRQQDRRNVAETSPLDYYRINVLIHSYWLPVNRADWFGSANLGHRHWSKTWKCYWQVSSAQQPHNFISYQHTCSRLQLSAVL